MRFAANLTVCVLASLFTLWLCRWMKRRDPLIGLTVQVGVVLRLWGGLILFSISYLKLPMLQRLYLTDGFWELAPDARGYYWAATIAAEEGLRTVTPWSASPAFVKVLALWFRTVGISPASAVLLNVFGYLGIAAILVAALGRDGSDDARKAVRLSLLAFTFSPAFLLFGTQALKDQFFALLLAGICGAAWVGFRALRPSPGPKAVWAGVFAAAAAALCNYLIAGIRPYVAFLLILAAGGAAATFTFRRRPRQLPAYLFACTLVVALLWMSFKAGAGPYYGFYESRLLGAVGISAGGSQTPAGAILAAREGFVNAGGATNVIFRFKRHEGAGPLERAWETLAQIGVGTAVLLVPISLLKWMSLVQFDGGKGLLVVTDIDTLFIDLTLVAILLLLKRTWNPPRPNREYVLFTAGLCGVLAVLMAFVVTNYGSLFRLRLIVAALAWLLPLAVVRPGIGGPHACSPASAGAAWASRR
jgi:hypothetical protein